ncbi:hypothetical protein [Paenibacillus thalictri]|uniref:Uncharacterized protein n=1 Tax=Paenibacillus thalictri TaxID=2527873 RepID=A0A4Q9E0Z0_9BACL|nr:hypothetical protein [Paenibacillus thalictri]TBL81823.1 hypothetical protein EYB31_02195 [Paenibacillus thalictri]
MKALPGKINGSPNGSQEDFSYESIFIVEMLVASVAMGFIASSFWYVIITFVVFAISWAIPFFKHVLMIGISAAYAMLNYYMLKMFEMPIPDGALVVYMAAVFIASIALHINIIKKLEEAT